MIVVTGATGQLGSQIVDRLLERVPADDRRRQRPRRRQGRARSPSAACGSAPETSPTRPRWSTPSRAPTRCSSSPPPSAAPAPRREPRRHRRRPRRGSQTHPLHQPPGRLAGLALRRPAHARRDRGHLAGWGSRSPPCATASTRAPLGHSSAGAGDRPARRAGGRPGVLDRARRPGRGRRHRPGRGGRARRRHGTADRAGAARPRGGGRHPQRHHGPHRHPGRRQRRGVEGHRRRSAACPGGRRLHPWPVPRGATRRVRRHRPDAGDPHRPPPTSARSVLEAIVAQR